MNGKPKRGDVVEHWLREKRDEKGSLLDDGYWRINAMLDEYRERADYGLTLDADQVEPPS